MSKKKSSRSGRVYSFLITALVICAAALCAAIAIQSRIAEHRENSMLPLAQSGANSATPAPLSLDTATPAPSAEPSPEASPTATPGTAEATYDFLPVYSRGETDENVIAITLDECTNQTNLGYALAAAQHYGAKLTLFPLGQAVMEDGMDDIIRSCVQDLGFEVENRTWSNGQLYRLSETELAVEIWSADIAVDYVLGLDYDMHFFRMYGGSGARDTRTHAYLKQLGYDAIVTWTVSASTTSLEDLMSSLEPGNIYLFNTSEEDVRKLISFMEFAADQGYEMVTLNELLGYEDNAMTASETDILSQVMPALQDYEPVRISLSVGDRAWQVLLVQSRLAELGYLAQDGVDGIYGESTSSAISQFQAACGLMGTGIATTETQNRLFADDAPANSGPTPTIRPVATATPQPSAGAE